MFRTVLTISALLLSFASVCIADEPLEQYSSPKNHFQFSYPASWKRVSSKVPAAEILLKPPLAAGAGFVITTTDVGQAAVPTSAIGEITAAQLKKTLTDAVVDSTVDMKLGGEPARHLILHGQSAQKHLVTLDAVVAGHGTMMISILLRADSDSIQSLMQPFDRILSSFVFTAAATEPSALAAKAPTTIPTLRDYISRKQGYAVEFPPPGGA